MPSPHSTKEALINPLGPRNPLFIPLCEGGKWGGEIVRNTITLPLVVATCSEIPQLYCKPNLIYSARGETGKFIGLKPSLPKWYTKASGACKRAPVVCSIVQLKIIP